MQALPDRASPVAAASLLVRRATSSVLTALVLIGLVGCECGPTQTPLKPGCVVHAGTLNTFLVPGVVAHLDLGIEFDCVGPFPIVDDVRVDVRDDANRTVTHTASHPFVSFPAPSTTLAQSGRATSRISFVPDRPGIWHIALQFEPSAGAAQFEVAAIDLLADAGSRILPAPLDQCIGIAVTSRNTVLCVRGISPFALSAWPYAQTVEYDTYRGLAIEGDALWVARLARLERYEDDGSGLMRTNVSSQLLPPGPLLAVHGTSVWVLGEGESQLLEAAAVPDGGVDFVAHPLTATTPLGMAAAEEGPLMAFSTVVTFWRPDAGSNALQLNSTFLAQGAEALWMRSPNGLTAVTAPAGRGLTTSFVAIPRGEARDAVERALPGFVPLVHAPLPTSSTLVVPKVAGPKISLQYFDPGPDYLPLLSATRTQAIARSRDGGNIIVMER